jgi:hypothetical protein
VVAKRSFARLVPRRRYCSIQQRQSVSREGPRSGSSSEGFRDGPPVDAVRGPPVVADARAGTACPVFFAGGNGSRWPLGRSRRDCPAGLGRPEHGVAVLACVLYTMPAVEPGTVASKVSRHARPRSNANCMRPACAFAIDNGFSHSHKRPAARAAGSAHRVGEAQGPQCLKELRQCLKKLKSPWPRRDSTAGEKLKFSCGNAP